MAKSITTNNLSLIFRIAVASIWLNAGILGKLLNPGFLNPASTDYVGLTLQYLAEGSVIKGFLYAISVSHPTLVGVLVMTGEISFGVLTLLGLMTRLANTVAFYTNLIYFLSASWTGAEEYGINLLMMIIDAYLIIYGSDKFSIDSIISKRVKTIDNVRLWVIVGSAIYVAVIIYLLM